MAGNTFTVNFHEKNRTWDVKYKDPSSEAALKKHNKIYFDKLQGDKL